ncbi:hypothetical protein D3C72_132400 [compost metagenome]
MTTKANTPERTADALKLLEDGIKKLTSSEEWARYLQMQAAFHTYSFSNVQLILAQRADATRVAGFKTWEKLGRMVRKGEKALWILAPRHYKPKDSLPAPEAQDGSDDTEQLKVYFRAVPVFDISQTEGDELPSLVKKLVGDNDGGAFERLKAFSESRGCPVTVEAITGRSNGYFAPLENRIVVRKGLAPVQAAKTLIHEIAHSFLHTDLQIYQAHRGDCELEAESVAFVVLCHFGIDSGNYSFGYVTGWQGGDEAAIKALKASAQRIQVTAKTIIEGIQQIAEEDPSDE